LNSAIYQGSLRHRRFEPVGHEFEYRLFMLYLDLAELDSVFEGSRLFSTRGRAIAEFRRSDHLGDPATPLDDAVRALVASRTGRSPTGPIRLLTHLRYFGYVFNPVSFYYCFDEEGGEVEYVVAEVNNTPWGERHCYVLPVQQPTGGKTGKNGALTFKPKKVMHVSPFMPMDIDYDWRLGEPASMLNVHMVNNRHDQKIFDATLRMQRKEITPASLAGVLMGFPLMTLRIIAAIHWQALRLWLKKCPFYAHPGKPVEPGLMENHGQ
jgi:DUF1365 family protein